MENTARLSKPDITEDGLDLDALRELLALKEGEEILSPPPIPKKQALNVICTIASAINTVYKQCSNPKYSDDSQSLKFLFMELNATAEMMGLYFHITPTDIQEHIAEAVKSGDMILLTKDETNDDAIHSYG